MVSLRKVIGITGSIAAGKSTVARMFVPYGYAVQDADKAVHKLYHGNHGVIRQIGDIFKGVVVDKRVDRDALRAYICKNPKAILVLQNIVHPALKNCCEDFIRENERCVLDVPLLFESGIFRLCHKNITVICNSSIRKERMDKHKGNKNKILQILKKLQMTQQQKAKRSDFIIQADKNLNHVEQQINYIVGRL